MKILDCLLGFLSALAVVVGAYIVSGSSHMIIIGIPMLIGFSYMSYKKGFPLRVLIFPDKNNG